MNTIIAVVCLFVAGNFGRIYYQNAQEPDIGITDGKLASLSKKPNNVSSQTDIKEKFVAPLPMKETLEITTEAILSAVSSYGNAKVVKQTDNYIYVVFTTKLMKYKDDVEFYIDSENQLVHFRSASRAGYSDMGLNRKRYDELAKLYSNQ